MPNTRPAYSAEYRRKLVELARAGRTVEELAQEFEPSTQTIRNRIAQAERDAGKRSDGLTSAEREDIARLRRENKQLRIEREILSKSRDLVRQGDRLDPVKAFEFVKAHRAQYPIVTLRSGCQTVAVRGKRTRPSTTSRVLQPLAGWSPTPVNDFQ